MERKPSDLMLEALRLAMINDIYGHVVAHPDGRVLFAHKSAVRAAIHHKWLKQTSVVEHHYTRTPVYSITETGRKVLEEEDKDENSEQK